MPKRRSGKSIEDYRAKRDFERTPEPPPGSAPGAEARSAFVVHRHEARRLHYDLRLEMEGVLKSWAVPRGFSYDPKVKKLAVRTEDHPLEYERFEGVIPKDSYGAGTMTIWDQGRFALARDENGGGPRAIEEGKLEILLFGKKLRGEWHLVRTKSDKDEWILFKSRDRYARSEDEPAPVFDLTEAVAAPFPEDARRMEVSGSSAPFSHPDWMFEMKLEGRRVAAEKRGERVRLLCRGQDLAPALPAIAGELGAIRAENALLDGVLVVLDDERRPSRERLEARLREGTGEPVSFYCFDVLYYEEWDVRPLPLVERKALLASILPKQRHILYVDPVPTRGEDLVEAAAAAGLSAVIAKEAASAYTGGPSPAWKEIETRAAASSPRRRIKLSNLDKVYWPDEGYTKGELLDYYREVSDSLLPYLYDRPVHMLRYPDGIKGKSFYQKDAPGHLPDWIPTEPIESDTRGEVIRYIICNDRDTLLYLVNLGSIDLHPWLSRRGSLDAPDWAVLDLDPDESPFPQVVKVARALGKVLRGIGLRPYLKTSGASGLHIYVPLREGYAYKQAQWFAEAIARYVASEQKDVATVDRVVSRRSGKVYIDFLQNRRGQTVVPAYVVRPVPGAWVSAPLDWDELDSDLHPSRFTMKNILERIEKRGDLFRGSLRDRQDLLPAIEAFQRIYLNA